MKTFIKILVLGVFLSSTASLSNNRTRNRLSQRFERWFPAFPASASGETPAPDNLPSFRFATSSGEGMGEVCACSAVSAASGPALALTRSGNAVCTAGGDGYRSTGINNGDLITCSTNQPRVELNSQGVKGVRNEYATNNAALWSSAWENVAWIKYQDAAAGLPTVIANAATSAYGTLTADLITLFATPNTNQSSLIYQPVCSNGQPCTLSVYAKGCIEQTLSDAGIGCFDGVLSNGADGGLNYPDGGAARLSDGGMGSGAFDICTGTGGSSCASCNYVATSYTRCSRQGIQTSSSSAIFGNATFYNGSILRPFQRVLVHSGQAEVQYNWYTSPIETTTALATRQSDVWNFDLGTDAGITSNVFCMAATHSAPRSDLFAPHYSSYTWLSPSLAEVNQVAASYCPVGAAGANACRVYGYIGPGTWTTGNFTNISLDGGVRLLTYSAPDAGTFARYANPHTSQTFTGGWSDAGVGTLIRYVTNGGSGAYPSNSIMSDLQADSSPWKCQ